MIAYFLLFVSYPRDFILISFSCICECFELNPFSRSDIESVLNSIYEAIFCTKSDDIELSSHQDVLEVFTNAAIFSLKVQGGESMSLPDFRSWCSLVPSARKFLGSLSTPPDSGLLSCSYCFLQSASVFEAFFFFVIIIISILSLSIVELII